MNIGERFNPYRLFHGSYIPNCILKLSVNILSSSEKIVWARLGQYAGKDGRCYPSQEQLAKEVGLSVQRVQAILQSLDKKEFIEIIKPTGKERLMHLHNTYVFIWNEYFEESDDDITQFSGPIALDRSEDIALDRCYKENPIKENPIKENPIKENHLNNSIQEKKMDDVVPRTRKESPIPSKEVPEPIIDKNKEFYPLAERLVAMVDKHRHLSTPSKHIKTWANEIRLCKTEHKTTTERITRVLDWYEDHIGEEFVPQAFSGSSFRIKFPAIIDAIGRLKSSTKPKRSSRSENPHTRQSEYLNDDPHKFKDMQVEKFIS